MRVSLTMLLISAGWLAGCSCGCGSEGADAAEATGSDSGTAAGTATETTAAVQPCPHVYFGEAEFQWTLDRAAQALVAADLDGDGLRDLVMTVDGGDIAVLRNRGRGAAAGGKAFDVPLRMRHADAGLGVMDWNGDGRLDLVAVQLNWSVKLFENRGGLIFEEIREEPIPLESAGEEVALADMNGDGREDIIVYGGRGVVVWPRPDASGVLGEPFMVEIEGSGVRRGAAADLDGDGVPDLAMAAFSGDPFLVVAFGDGQGGLERVTPYTRSDRIRGFEAGIVDVDADGLLDVFVVGSTWELDPADTYDRKPRFVWMRNAGGGQLQEAAVLEPSPGAMGWTVAHNDLDRDGFPELVALAGGLLPPEGDPIEGAYHLLSYESGELAIVAPAFIEAGTVWSRILIEDIDGDGFEDFVRATSGVSVRWGCPR